MDHLWFYRYFYQQVKYMMENHHKLTYRLRHYFECAVVAGEIGRLVPSFLMLLDPDTFPAYQFDYVAYYGRQHPMMYDLFFCSFVTMFLLFEIYSIQVLFLSKDQDRLVWHEYYDSVIWGTDCYDQCRITEEIELEWIKTVRARKIEMAIRKHLPLFYVLVPRVIREWLVNVVTLLVVQWNFDHVDKQRLKLKKLRYFPQLSVRSRARLISTQMGLDSLNIGMVISIFTTLIYASYLFLPILLKPFSKWYYLISVVDISTLVICIHTIARTLNLFNSCSIFITVLYSQHFRYLTKKISGSTSKQCMWKKRLTQQMVLREHTTLCAIILRVGGYWSRIIFITLMVNMPINIYAIYRLVFIKLTPSDRRISFYFMLVQSVIFFQCVLPLAYYNKRAHEIAKWLPRQQMSMNGRNISLKVKYLNFYERVTQTLMAYGVRLGPTSIVSYSSVAKLLLLYFGQLVAGFNLLNTVYRKD